MTRLPVSLPLASRVQLEEKTSLFSLQAVKQPKPCAQTSFCMQGGKKQEAGWGPRPSARKARALRAPTLGEPLPAPPRPSAPRLARRKAGKRGPQETARHKRHSQAVPLGHADHIQNAARARRDGGDTSFHRDPSTWTLDAEGHTCSRQGQRTELLGPEPWLCGKAPGRGS